MLRQGNCRRCLYDFLVFYFFVYKLNLGKIVLTMDARSDRITTIVGASEAPKKNLKKSSKKGVDREMLM